MCRWAEEDSFPEYMCKAEDRLSQEQQRVSNYLHSSTEEKLLKVGARTPRPVALLSARSDPAKSTCKGAGELRPKIRTCR